MSSIFTIKLITLHLPFLFVLTRVQEASTLIVIDKGMILSHSNKRDRNRRRVRKRKKNKRKRERERDKKTEREREREIEKKTQICCLYICELGITYSTSDNKSRLLQNEILLGY